MDFTGERQMAAVNYFLKIDGIPGESQDHKHKDEIQLESFFLGSHPRAEALSYGGGGGAGKVQMQDFHFVMKINKATPKLFLACANGEHIKSAILTCRKAGKEQQEFLIVKLSDVLVSSYQSGGSSAGDVVPTEQISLTFAKVEFEYKEQKPDGTLAGGIKANYDLERVSRTRLVEPGPSHDCQRSLSAGGLGRSGSGAWHRAQEQSCRCQAPYVPL